MFKKICSILLAFTIAGCTSLSFNQRYENAGWSKVLIAPIKGEESKLVEQESEHQLSTSPKLSVISASSVRYLFEQHNLSEQYNKDPMTTMFKLAKIVKANGVLFTEINVEQNSLKYDMTSNKVSLYAKLIDIETGDIVASSQINKDSVFISMNSLVQSASSEMIEELNLFFDKLRNI